MHILLLEDDPTIELTLRQNLVKAGYSVDSVGDGLSALDKAHGSHYDVMIIDLMIPGISGTEVIGRLRERGDVTPALILSAKREVADRVEGLRAGGDDYLVKPFVFDELLARVEALLRRSKNVVEASRLQSQLKLGEVVLDLHSHKAWRGQTEIDLQSKEFALLEYFLRNAGRTLTKTQILKKIWNYDFDPQTNVVDVLVWRLRSKIDRDYEKKVIHTVRGIGFVAKI